MKQAVIDAHRSVTVSPTALVIEYALIALYGALCSWVGVTTLDIVGGPLWAFVWPLAIVVFSLGAIVGVVVSSRLARGGVELVTTLLLVALLLGYSAAIIVRVVEVDGELNRLPVAVLPVALSVHPFSRLVRIARGTVVR